MWLCMNVDTSPNPHENVSPCICVCTHASVDMPIAPMHAYVCVPMSSGYTIWMCVYPCLVYVPMWTQGDVYVPMYQCACAKWSHAYMCVVCTHVSVCMCQMDPCQCVFSVYEWHIPLSSSTHQHQCHPMNANVQGCPRIALRSFVQLILSIEWL